MNGRPSVADVRRPVLAGHQRVDAIWWPAAWMSERARQREVLAHWTPGALLHRFDDGDLLCLSQPRELDCGTLAGWPLRRIAGTLCSADVSATDLAGRPIADAWIAEGGILRPRRLADATRGDPSEWLAVVDTLAQPFDLSTPAPDRALVLAPPKALHEVLGPSVPNGPAVETRQLMQALKAAPRRAAPAAARGTPASPAAQGASGRMWPRWIFVALLAVVVLRGCGGADAAMSGFGTVAAIAIGLACGIAVRKLLRGAGVIPTASAVSSGRLGAGTGTGTGQRASGKQGSLRGSLAARTATIRARLARSPIAPQRWRQWAARAAATTGLSQLLGARHAAYMQRVLAMFDEGRLDDALRHAIPLGEDGLDSLGQAFGALGPRSDLALRERQGASTSINFGDDLRAHLRALYRRTMEQLDAGGRIDEAVFVLAELLRNRQEALDYLERHGRLAQAAELAFAWDMPGAQIVRLHALAGDWRQATLVARRDSVFSEAVILLEKRWPEPAARLRVEWAQSLAARGLALQAIRAIWPLAEERGRAAPWLAATAQAGGAIAARALAWRAQCWSDTLAAHVDELESLRSDPTRVDDRAALADELLGMSPPVTPDVRRLAAFVAGATIADHVGGDARLDKTALARLVQLAGDAALSADMPPLRDTSMGSGQQPLRQRAEPVEGAVPAAGLQGIVDALALPDGEFLLALGEGGAVRIDAHGRRLAHFAVPAHSLVGAADGGSALALARREQVWRVSRLDILQGQAVDLGLHAFDAFAGSFDDAGWTVAVGARVQVLDTRSDGLREALWQVGELPGRVLAIDRDDVREHWVMADDAVPGGLQQWVYELPRRRLQARDAVAPPSESDVKARILARGRGLMELRPDGQAIRPWLVTAGGPCGAALPLTDARLVLAAGDWVALARDTEAGVSLQLVRLANARVDASWMWPDGAPTVRFQRGLWLLFDACGRLVLLDSASSRQVAVSLR